MGLDTRIGKTGLPLSGGQRQRILIARALYRKPRFLVLDEATSSLDGATEAAIMSNIYARCQNSTVVVAAHRLCTVSRADNIIVIKRGQVAESGTHRQLMGLHGAYWELQAAQSPQAS